MIVANKKSVDKKSVDKEKALDLAVSQIRKQFGEGAVMRLGDEPSNLAIEA